jgi:hypothetical protein
LINLPLFSFPPEAQEAVSGEPAAHRMADKNILRNKADLILLAIRLIISIFAGAFDADLS